MWEGVPSQGSEMDRRTDWESAYFVWDTGRGKAIGIGMGMEMEMRKEAQMKREQGKEREWERERGREIFAVASQENSVGGKERESGQQQASVCVEHVTLDQVSDSQPQRRMDSKGEDRHWDSLFVAFFEIESPRRPVTSHFA